MIYYLKIFIIIWISCLIDSNLFGITFQQLYKIILHSHLFCLANITLHSVVFYLGKLSPF